MKYFAKLLPYDGDLKEGDKCLHPEYGIGIFKGRDASGNIAWDSMHLTDDNYPEPKKEEINFDEKCDNLKPVKLFLCTHDVVVGSDNCAAMPYHLLSLRKEIIGEDNDTVPQWKINLPEANAVVFWTKEETFKVIGAISATAIWVNDNDEFGDDDVEIVPHYTIRIKCDKCNTFH
jgi:hypothetical protein